MANKTRISLVTPSYNQAPYLEQTIRSVTDQKYPNLQYIVIDGGSSDGSSEIIKRYSEHLDYWVSEPDKGHGEALNKGFQLTDGDIMGWVNSDDMLAPGSLNTIADIFDTFPDIDWIQGYTTTWNEDGIITHCQQSPLNKYDYLNGRYTWIQQESTFWRRSLWEKAGSHISQDLRLMIDGELWTRFFLHSDLCHVSCILGGFRSHGGNRSHSKMEECHKEMHASIATMRKKAATAELATASQLAKIDRLCESLSLTFRIGMPRLYRAMGRTIARDLYQKTSYRVIRWDVPTSSWTLKQRPYRPIIDAMPLEE